MSNSFDENLIYKYVEVNKQKEALEKLKTGYPVQYIIGNVEFMGLTFNVNENVLIPRFETEYLVSDLLKLMQDNNMVNPSILDIGTGSGCIAISLKKLFPSSVLAIDKSKEALTVAKENAKLNNVDIDFQELDIFKAKINEKFDVIVSNPPYVPFDGEVDDKIKYEPQEAIFAEDNGLIFYKHILNIAKDIINKKSIIALEIGINQGKELEKLAKTHFPNAKYILKQDLNGIDRYFYIINE